MQDRTLQSSYADGIPPTALRKSATLSSGERAFSALAGGMLILFSMSRDRGPGLFSSMLGIGLLARGAVGYCPLMGYLRANPVEKGVADAFNWRSAAAVSRSATINKPVEQVYRRWKDLSSYPRFMEMVEEVRDIGNGRWHWIARMPAGQRIEWDTVLTEDEANRQISWQSAEDSNYKTSGTVTFKPAPGDRGTEVTFMLAYQPPGGAIGGLFASLFRADPMQQARRDLISFKQMTEAGEIATPAIKKSHQQQISA